MNETLQQEIYIQPDPAFDAQFDVGLDFGVEGGPSADLTDEEFISAACGAVADIFDKHNAPPEDGGLSNEEIFGRLRGVFDATAERYSADFAQEVQASMQIMEAIGHAACGNHELMTGAQENGLIPDPIAETHADHGHSGHHHEDDDNDDPHNRKKRRR